jgi:hypothetical protein
MIEIKLKQKKVLTISDFHIAENGTTATFTAGKEISITNEFSSEEGTETCIYIDNNLACTETVFRKAKTNETINTKTEEKQHTILNSLNVFPNPAENQIILSFLNNDIKNGTVTLYNSLGQKAYELNFTGSDMYNSQLTLNISELNNGIYNGTVKRNGKLTFFKFVKSSN